MKMFVKCSSELGIEKYWYNSKKPDTNSKKTLMKQMQGFLIEMKYVKIQAFWVLIL